MESFGEICQVQDILILVNFSKLEDFSRIPKPIFKCKTLSEFWRLPEPADTQKHVMLTFEPIGIWIEPDVEELKTLITTIEPAY